LIHRESNLPLFNYVTKEGRSWLVTSQILSECYFLNVLEVLCGKWKLPDFILQVVGIKKAPVLCNILPKHKFVIHVANIGQWIF